MKVRGRLAGVILILVLGRADCQEPPRILIGVEYCYPGGGKTFGQLKVPLTKPYAEMHEWGAMQKSKDAPINFTKLDSIVRDYQDAGFQEIYLSLKANSKWASRHWFKNSVPKAEYWPLYENWLKAIVDRYDGDGKNDMPGLRRPVRYFEIGTEFSSYQPEPTADYMEMLERGYKTIKAANKNAIVLHAAFLTTTAFKNHPKPGQYEAAFASMEQRFMDKKLKDIHAVLDRPDLFDAVNFHALGDPGEIEDTMAWLRYEMKQRKYTRPIAISDTMPTPFIAWGNAVGAGFGKPGIIIPPAVESDRPRLNEYFKKLIAQDAKTVSWNHAFCGADMIKKTIIAADMGAIMINTSFMEDLTLLQSKLLGAGAGTTAWAGMAETKISIFLNERRSIISLRPNFYAIGQLQKNFGNYRDLKKLPSGNSEVRMYSWKQAGKLTWAAWLEPKRVFLPEDKTPQAKASIAAGPGRFAIEKMIDQPGQTEPETTVVVSRDGRVDLTLTPRPVFIYAPSPTR